MQQIKTAKEFLLEFENKYPKLKCEVSTLDDKSAFYNSVQGAIITIDVMIEFAKLHCQAFSLSDLNLKEYLETIK